MTAPNYVPPAAADAVRPDLRPDPPQPWRANRPADLVPGPLRHTHGFGSPGPDQGYGMTLARRFVDRLVLTEGEQAADAVAGCVAVAMRRASGFGRAPMIGDLEMAFGVWGFLAAAPDELVTLRKPLFGGASHHYAHQRHIADMVAPATLRLTPSEVRARVTATQWRDLFSSP